MIRVRKYYAVKRGRVPGVYENWEIAKQQVEGYPNAEYRSFASKEDALAYLKGESWRCPKTPERTIFACVDGSYRDGVCGSAIVLCDDEGLHEFYFWTDKPDLATMRNVAGEVLAVLFTIDYALRKGARHLIIKHDFENLQKWASGEYSAKTSLTTIYVQSVKLAQKKGVRIDFEKIEAHSKDPCNQRADELAKLAVSKNSNTNWNWEELKDVFRSADSL